MATPKKTQPKPAQPPRPRTVRAINPGVYGQYREAGDVFDLFDGLKDFSSRWMVDVTDEAESGLDEGEEPKAGSSGFEPDQSVL